MGNKMDMLIESVNDIKVSQAKMEQYLADLKPRCDSHGDMLKEHTDRIQSLTGWRNRLIGAYAVASAVIGAWLGHSIKKG